MAKSIFSVSVVSKLNLVMKDDIRESILGSPEMKKEIQRVLQMANRRAQNIEKSGVVSPAYQSLVLEGRTGYSKFSITGTDLNNKTAWQKAKYEYAKAIEYLNNPTSSSTGAKQYVKHIAKKYDVSDMVANNILRSATSTEFKDSKIPLMNYRAMIDTYMTDTKNQQSEMNQNAEQHAQALEKQVDEMAQQVADEINDFTESIVQDLSNAFRIK